MDDDQKTSLSLRQFTSATTVLVAMLVATMVATTSGFWPGVIGLACAIMLTGLMIGVLLGFLFSVPRVLAQPAAKDVESPVDGNTKRRLLQTNTNLERISDWLTTMLVGVGLSQLGNINAALFQFRQFVGGYHFGTPEQTNALEIASPFCLIFGLIAGFITMYIYTRLVLAKIFDQVENDLSKQTQDAVANVASKAIAQGFSSRALDEIKDAGTPVTVEASVNAMRDLLYQPNGYKTVIEMGDRLDGTPATSQASYWFYLAAAHGQQLQAALASKDDAQATAARRSAIDAAARAIQISPSYRGQLSSLSNEDNYDNDLWPLRDDDEFRRLVGR